MCGRIVLPVVKTATRSIHVCKSKWAGAPTPNSFDNFRDRAAAQVLSAFATDTAFVLDHAEKSSEIPAAQALLAELGIAAGAIVTLDCKKNILRSPPTPTLP